MTRRARAGVIGWWLALVAGPLGLGCALYVVARPKGLVFWRWAESLGASPALDSVRAGLAPLCAGMPSWVSFTLPDALWVFALTAALARLWRDAPLRVRAAYLAVPLLLGPGAELLQLAGLPGTFDPLDLAATLLAFVAGAALASTGASLPLHRAPARGV